MPTNPYFNHFTSQPERDLYEDLVVESIKNSGIDIYYIPREYLRIDPVLLEPEKSTFTTTYAIEAYVKDVMNFQGPGDILTKFGLQVQNDTRFEISKRRFNELKVPDRIRPLEGDLVYIGEINDQDGYSSFAHALFEITHVNRDPRFWQLGKYYTYELVCQLYTHSYDKIETDIEGVNSLNITNNNIEDVKIAINQGITDQQDSLINFDEKNPFGEL